MENDEPEAEITVKFEMEYPPYLDVDDLEEVRRLLIDEGQGSGLRAAVRNVDRLIEERSSNPRET